MTTTEKTMLWIWYWVLEQKKRNSVNFILNRCHNNLVSNKLLVKFSDSNIKRNELIKILHRDRINNVSTILRQIILESRFQVGIVVTANMVSKITSQSAEEDSEEIAPTLLAFLQFHQQW